MEERPFHAFFSVSHLLQLMCGMEEWRKDLLNELCRMEEWRNDLLANILLRCGC